MINSSVDKQNQTNIIINSGSDDVCTCHDQIYNQYKQKKPMKKKKNSYSGLGNDLRADLIFPWERLSIAMHCIVCFVDVYVSL